LPGELDLILANLPYLPAEDRSRYRDLSAEPDEALFAPGDGLGFYRRLLRSAEQRLRDGGVVMLQLHRQVFAVERAELAPFRAGLAELVPQPLRAAA
jgi:methylase of polypeptide subunit release factors